MAETKEVIDDKTLKVTNTRTQEEVVEYNKEDLLKQKARLDELLAEFEK